MFDDGALINTGYKIPSSMRFRASSNVMASRTPTVNGSSTKGTLSCWVKFSGNGIYGLMGCRVAADYFFMLGISDNRFGLWMQTPSSWRAIVFTAGQFRDPSAWYHVVIHYDTNGGVGAGTYLKVYVNGVQQTLSTNVTPNGTPFTGLNSTSYQMQIGYGYSNVYFDGNMAEYYWFDGVEKQASDFGQFNEHGVWVPKSYAGPFTGANTFYLPFIDGTSLASLGKDYSGNSNNFTIVNASLTAGPTYDRLVDTPTNNHEWLNTLRNGFSGVTFSDANLRAVVGGNSTYRNASSVTLPDTHAIYFEATPVNVTANPLVGVGDTAQTDAAWQVDTTINANFWYYSAATGNKINGNGGGVAYGSGVSAGTSIGVAFNPITGKLWFRNASGYFAYGDPVADTNAAFTGLTGKSLAVALFGGSGSSGGNTWTINFGQQPFTYPQPIGFKTLCTANLPAARVPNGRKHFDVDLYTGSGVARNRTGFQFQPDLVWNKSRSVASSNHEIYDAVRGATKFLSSNTTNAESTLAQAVTAFNADGYSLGDGTSSNSNTNGASLVSWLWKAGGSAVSNTAGSITSQVSVNRTAGFSIVTYTGTGAAATVGHGLGITPKFVVVKARGAASNSYWRVRHESLATNGNLLLNGTDAWFNAVTVAGGGGVANLTSTVFGLVNGISNCDYVNQNGIQYVAYCFAEVPGFSKFGSYTGNGSADGPFVFCGFRPRWVIVKRADSGEQWNVFDAVRDPDNSVNLGLIPNANNVEYDVGAIFDFTANGFKVRYASSPINTNGGTYIFAAFAEYPFGGSNISPATAR